MMEDTALFCSGLTWFCVPIEKLLRLNEFTVAFLVGLCILVGLLSLLARVARSLKHE